MKLFLFLLFLIFTPKPEDLASTSFILCSRPVSYTHLEGCVPTRGSGNYSSDEAKEIARLQRELRDTKDALEILKKAISILGK